MLNHAGYKALLFLSLGWAIHLAENFQDLRIRKSFFLAIFVVSLIFAEINNIVGNAGSVSLSVKDYVLTSAGHFVKLDAIFLQKTGRHIFKSAILQKKITLFYFTRVKVQAKFYLGTF